MDNAANWLEEKLHYRFSDQQLLEIALTHRSVSGVNNERLEFLGDAVLQLVISELVFDERQDASEGQLSRIRSTMVRDATLSELGFELGVGDHLRLGSGEKKSGGHRRASILADAVEAIFGAIYLDAGIGEARRVILAALGQRIHDLPEGSELRDPKTRLQEYLQGRQLALPDYSIEAVSGKAHKQLFSASCKIPQLELKTVGSGTTRRDAEQEAADFMLRRLSAAG